MYSSTHSETRHWWRWVASFTPWPLYPEKKAQYHLKVGWVDLKLGLEDYGEVKICWSCWDSKSRTVATDYDILAPASLPTETSKYICKIQQTQPVGSWSGRNSSRYIYILTHAEVLWHSESLTLLVVLCVFHHEGRAACWLHFTCYVATDAPCSSTLTTTINI
jgi:hypothetical protein